MKFIENLIPIGSMDVEFIESLYDLIGSDFDFTTLHTYKLSELDANAIIYELYRQINEAVFKEVQSIIELNESCPDMYNDGILKSCQERIDNFNPFINCIDSHYQNELDHCVNNESIETVALEISNMFLAKVA